MYTEYLHIRAVNFAPFIKKLNIAMDISSLKILYSGKLKKHLPWVESRFSCRVVCTPSLKLDFLYRPVRVYQIEVRCPYPRLFTTRNCTFFKIKWYLCSGRLTKTQGGGADSIPGGGAEILSDRCRNILSPNKCTAQEWLEVMREAHKLGMRTTATMMFGHIETVEERIEHLEKNPEAPG